VTDKTMDALLHRWMHLHVHEHDWFLRMMRAWDEPQRRYHNADHLLDVLTVLDQYVGKPSRELRIAAWFHDYVYEPGATDNEARSAAAALDFCQQNHIDATTTQAIEALIHSTIHGGSHAPTLLSEADLVVLARPWEQYQAYVVQVREEYSMFEDSRFRAGRLAFLNQMLAQPAIFTWKEFLACEGQAQHNLRREQVELQS
jgi:predicted metal-dependent HD superfamily phosphohydrolase